MTAFNLPVADAPAEDWGRLAVSLPGWRWVPGMVGRNEIGGTDRIMDQSEASQANADIVPDPDDPATAGCLLALAGAPHRLLPTVEAWLSGAPVEGIKSLGRAVIADVYDQWRRWPGGGG